jgi:uncharacterized protein YecE (DUF72 family)
VIRFGPAGWEYRDWAGIVYPRPAPRGFDALRYLAAWFDTVEVNSTFYRSFEAGPARRWAERVEGRPGFRFAAKVWRRFTHEREQLPGAGEVAEGRAALDALREEGRLGAALLQFPWSFKRSEENEEWLRAVFRMLAGLPLVLEVRHASWDAADFLAELGEAGVGIVNVDQPMFPNSMGPSARATSPVAYVRVHGRNFRDWFREGAGRDARYDYLYRADELRPWAARVRTLDESAGRPDVYVVTNNHFEGKAVANAKMLEAMVAGRRVAAPPTLVDRYGDALAPFADAAPAPPEAGQLL